MIWVVLALAWVNLIIATVFCAIAWKLLAEWKRSEMIRVKR
jgi:hypothetical protein